MGGSRVFVRSLAERAGRRRLPVWVRGGIGPNVAAGCMAAGAAGVVLDGALLLARESPLDPEWRERIARWDGSETTVIGPASAPGVRVFALRVRAALARLQEGRRRRRRGLGSGRSRRSRLAGRPMRACRSGRRLRGAAGPKVRDDRRDRPGRRASDFGGNRGGAGAPGRWRKARALAVAHGTRYPILQGPMTRVSDVAGFAQAVARRRGLAVSRPGTAARSGSASAVARRRRPARGTPWGVGILGFVPPELRAEQLAVVRDVRPPFALIAGGRPDQAAGLGTRGNRDLFARPSPGLLDQYLRDGSRRFVLEGRECGGHVGPRSSFVLWEQAVAVVGEALDRGIPADEVSLVFAGGIHDARSAALVAALAGPLAARGVKVGILVGTAYLFTQEAVATGAIVPRFQDEVASLRGNRVARVGARPPGAGEPALRSSLGSRKKASDCWPRGDRPRKSARPSRA